MQRKPNTRRQRFLEFRKTAKFLFPVLVIPPVFESLQGVDDDRLYSISCMKILRNCVLFQINTEIERIRRHPALVILYRLSSDNFFLKRIEKSHNLLLLVADSVLVNFRKESNSHIISALNFLVFCCSIVYYAKFRSNFQLCMCVCVWQIVGVSFLSKLNMRIEMFIITLATKY